MISIARARDLLKHKLVQNAGALVIVQMTTYAAPLLVMPTGGGKTIVFAHVTMLANGRGTRTLIVAHRIALIRQASAKLTAAGVRHGIIAPEFPEIDLPVQVETPSAPPFVQ